MNRFEMQSTEQIINQAEQILDLRIQMNTARAELGKSKLLLVLKPRGYGPRSEYREKCKSIMKNANTVKQLATALRKELGKMDIKEDDLEIGQALKEAADAKRQLGFWGRMGL